VEGWAAVDDASEQLLEAMPNSTEGCIRLALYVHQLAAEHGEHVFLARLEGEDFCCRMLAHIVSALIRLRA
jgi:hypothetical protein